jgi:uncharacterized protein YdhG (YjbR/CyaY superfamily)
MAEHADILSYLNSLPLSDRQALSALRQQILSIAPGLEERLSRGVPFFYHRGKRAVGYRSSKQHLSFFIMEGKVLDRFRKEFAMFDNSSTVIRFMAENPIPKEIIENLVRARMEEIEESLLK